MLFFGDLLGPEVFRAYLDPSELLLLGFLTIYYGFLIII